MIVLASGQVEEGRALVESADTCALTASRRHSGSEFTSEEGRQVSARPV